jgi:hypothetical protein
MSLRTTRGPLDLACKPAAHLLANILSPGQQSVLLHAASLIHASGTFVLSLLAARWDRHRAACLQPAQFLAAIERHHVTKVNLVSLWARAAILLWMPKFGWLLRTLRNAPRETSTG